MNIENLRAWTRDLRTTSLHQIHGYLYRATTDKDDGGPGGCCLGVGCVLAGLGHEQLNIGGSNALNVHKFSDVGVTQLPPREFIDWLGLDVPEEYREYREYNLALDWPHDHYPLDDSRAEVWLAELNDSGLFTFAMIADLIDYFGVKVVDI